MLTPGRRSFPAGDTGSALAEFVMVVPLLTLLTLSVMQVGLAMHVRNTVLDAAAEGARYAALADNGLVDGLHRTRELITAAIGPAYAGDITAGYGRQEGVTTVEVRVSAPLPLLGLLGFEHGLGVMGRAAVETLATGD
jgi:hypothetical protein